jgi:hypothetical protein
MAEGEICVNESVSGVDEVLLDASIVPFWSHNFSDVESAHQQHCKNVLWITFNEMYIQVMEQQVLLWKSHSRTFIC